MAINITVFPYISPRIIQIDDPQTDITIQEIVNAVRDWEDSILGEGFPILIDAAGKEDLGSGKYVGITATLQDAQIKFEARTTPLDNGSGRTCDATDSSGTQLYVDDADFVTAGVYAGCTVFNMTTGEMAVVYEVADQYTLNHFTLTGAGSSGWTSGDNYKVYPNERCSISGGNLVAVDDGGSSIDPILPSFNVQVSRESSTSAALLEGSGGVTAAAVADAVWDEALADHTDSGSAGEALDDASTYTIPTASDVADAVWDETLSEHSDSGSTGEALDDASEAAPTAGDVADAVWDEAAGDHVSSDTMGEQAQDTLKKAKLAAFKL